jgi:predicted MPP superfamily phosphohydrolase
MAKRFTRRKILQTLAWTGGGAAVVGLYTWRMEPHWLEITESELPVTGLAAELEGKTLAQLSDLHIGPKVDDDYIVETFQRVRDHGPDFVVFTGDWITYRSAAQYEQLKRVLEHVPHGKLGTIGILGNHDYGSNWRMTGVADEVSKIVRANGVTLLRNEAATIAGLQFVGLDDLWGPRFGPEKLLAERGTDASTIVLCHNPDAADKPVWSEYGGWILAGHTHGGQCKPPFLPPPLLPVANRRYTAGAFELNGNRKMYISRGVGHLLRVRFNCRPEVALFRLRPSS